MTIDAHVLQETWSILKQYIPQKDRQEAVDNLSSFYVDALNDYDLSEFATTDQYTQIACNEYLGDGEDDYLDEDEIEESDEDY